MNKLLNGLRNEYNQTVTENSAPTLISTFNDVLDYFYHAPAKRGQDTTTLFANAYAENVELALKAAFYVRDIRGGQGERKTFRQALRWLYHNDYPIFVKIVDLVPIYGRWDDILEYVESAVVRSVVNEQLRKGRFSENTSLLAKWMPSENASNKETVALANKWISALNMSKRNYRKMLSTLRARINVVERLMSSGNFDKINYEHVPSRAAMLYRKAYSKRDAGRYVAYLEAVKKGEKKINAATLYPYDLVQGYAAAHLRGYTDVTPITEVDDAIEALWKALPNYANSDENAIGVVDVSGSMYNGHGITPIFVSVALGIYLAERNHGAFKNNFMTFSENPTLVTLHNGSLKSKVDQVFKGNVGYNTNIQAVFQQLLTVAVYNKVPETDMPTRIFIFSDMEFDSPNIGSHGTNYQAIERQYRNAGYKMPTLVFWNIDSANVQTPVTMDQNGVFLVAGASPSIMQNALTTTVTNPMDMMLEKLNSDRYAAISEALR